MFSTFSGLFSAVCPWLGLVAGSTVFITVVGLPWAIPLGHGSFSSLSGQRPSTAAISRGGDLGTGPLGLVGNVIWFLVAGWWLALGHLSSALACFVTIIGIPFGIQHIKLALIALAPVGMTMVKTTSVVKTTGVMKTRD